MTDALNISPPYQGFSEVERMFVSCRDQLKPETVDWLVDREGIPRELVTTFAVVGVGKVREVGDWFDLDPTGVRRIIIAVRGRDDDVPFDPMPRTMARV